MKNVATLFLYSKGVLNCFCLALATAKESTFKPPLLNRTLLAVSSAQKHFLFFFSPSNQLSSFSVILLSCGVILPCFSL
jgi:hypothetical protein